MDMFVEYVSCVIGESLEMLEWMDDEIWVEVIVKYESFIIKIGYLDVWLDYFLIEIVFDDLFGNVQCILVWVCVDICVCLCGFVCDWEWFMLLQMVNVYYVLMFNEIVFFVVIL